MIFWFLYYGTLNYTNLLTRTEEMVRQHVQGEIALEPGGGKAAGCPTSLRVAV